MIYADLFSSQRGQETRYIEGRMERSSTNIQGVNLPELQLTALTFAAYIAPEVHPFPLDTIDGTIRLLQGLVEVCSCGTDSKDAPTRRYPVALG